MRQNQYTCKCHETGHLCGGCACVEVRGSRGACQDGDDCSVCDRLRTPITEEEQAAITVRDPDLAVSFDMTAPTLRSGELEGVLNVSRSGL